ncbi:MAG TPA: fasciclin domain-containing protein [Mucilaginibacter sp.]|jgi:uncharacterized surface protein with fasciclin (FAS1) repeats
MKKPILIVAVLVIFSLFSSATFAQTTPPAPAAAAPAAGGDAVASLTSSDNYTAFSIALRAAGLAETLEGAGPYTIFAPTNEAFGKIPSAQLDALMKDPAKLALVLKGHIIAGKMMKADVIKALTTGKGKATLKTLDGQDLTLSVANGKLQLADAAGNTALVTAFDLAASNGVIHGLNAVLVGK